MAAVTTSDGADTRSTDLRRLARGSAWNLAGSFASVLVQLLLPVVITRQLSSTDAGAFFSVTALFAILMSLATVGADTGVLWSLPRAKALDRRGDIPVVLWVSIVPVVLVSSAVATVVVLLAPDIAQVVVGDTAAARSEFASALYVLAPFLPVVAAYVILVSTSRGLGSIKPLVLIEKLGRNSLQTASVCAAVIITPSLLLAMVAWVAPYLAALIVMGLTVLRLVRLTVGQVQDSTPGSARSVAREFWSFSGPRALSRIFAVALKRFDVLLVSALRGLEEAAVYAVASRFLVLGLMFVQAIQQVMAPRISEFLAKRDVQRAQLIYETTTAWLILMSWPIYLVSAIFARVLLGVFGSTYSSGATAVVILCLSMLVATACGPVDTVLLMGGRSRWSLLNTGLALAVNVGVDLLLVPTYGINGAAVGWAAGIAMSNLLPLFQVHRFLAMHPFGLANTRAAATTLLCFGGVGVICRILLGATVAGCLSALVIGSAVYLLCLQRQQQALDLDALVSVIRRRRRK